MAAPLLIWDPAMLRYNFGEEHPLHPLRWELTWALARDLGVLDGWETTAPAAASDEQLGAVHTAAYIAAVRRASSPEMPSELAPRVGHGLGTADNPTFVGMHDAAALIAGGSITAATALARGEVNRAVNIAGGLHHAMPDHAAGFCVYNDAAVAIATLLAQGVGRVAYIDVDVHHGDGVQRAFYDDPRVLTVSIHESPLTLWPGTGFASESGRGAAAGTSVNIPLPAGSGDGDWLRAFHAVVPAVVASFRPDVLVTQHGADSHRDDPLADLQLSVDGQLASYRALRALADDVADGRWLALGGGGYSVVRVVPRAWTHLLAVVGGRDIDPSARVANTWRAMARAARPGVEPPETMSDIGGGTVDFQPWDGGQATAVDRAIMQVRREIFPLHGLDPYDPRD